MQRFYDNEIASLLVVVSVLLLFLIKIEERVFGTLTAVTYVAAYIGPSTDCSFLFKNWNSLGPSILPNPVDEVYFSFS